MLPETVDAFSADVWVAGDETAYLPASALQSEEVEPGADSVGLQSQPVLTPTSQISLGLSEEQSTADGNDLVDITLMSFVEDVLSEASHDGQALLLDEWLLTDDAGAVVGELGLMASSEQPSLLPTGSEESEEARKCQELLPTVTSEARTDAETPPCAETSQNDSPSKPSAGVLLRIPTNEPSIDPGHEVTAKTVQLSALPSLLPSASNSSFIFPSAATAGASLQTVPQTEQQPGEVLPPVPINEPSTAPDNDVAAGARQPSVLRGLLSSTSYKGAMFPSSATTTGASLQTRRTAEQIPANEPSTVPEHGMDASTLEASALRSLLPSASASTSLSASPASRPETTLHMGEISEQVASARAESAAKDLISSFGWLSEMLQGVPDEVLETHPFYHYPKVELRLTRKAFSEKVAAASHIGHASIIPLVSQCRSLLKKPWLTAEELESLLGYTEIICGYASKLMPVATSNQMAAFAIETLGRAFVVIDTLHCAAEVLGKSSRKRQDNGHHDDALQSSGDPTRATRPPKARPLYAALVAVSAVIFLAYMCSIFTEKRITDSNVTRKLADSLDGDEGGETDRCNPDAFQGTFQDGLWDLSEGAYWTLQAEPGQAKPVPKGPKHSIKVVPSTGAPWAAPQQIDTAKGKPIAKRKALEVTKGVISNKRPRHGGLPSEFSRSAPPPLDPDTDALIESVLSESDSAYSVDAWVNDNQQLPNLTEYSFALIESVLSESDSAYSVDAWVNDNQQLPNLTEYSFAFSPPQWPSGLEALLGETTGGQGPLVTGDEISLERLGSSSNLDGKDKSDTGQSIPFESVLLGGNGGVPLRNGEEDALADSLLSGSGGAFSDNAWLHEDQPAVSSEELSIGLNPPNWPSGLEGPLGVAAAYEDLSVIADEILSELLGGSSNADGEEKPRTDQHSPFESVLSSSSNMVPTGVGELGAGVTAHFIPSTKPAFAVPHGVASPIAEEGRFSQLPTVMLQRQAHLRASFASEAPQWGLSDGGESAQQQHAGLMRMMADKAPATFKGDVATSSDDSSIRSKLSSRRAPIESRPSASGIVGVLLSKTKEVNKQPVSASAAPTDRGILPAFRLLEGMFEGIPDIALEGHPFYRLPERQKWQYRKAFKLCVAVTFRQVQRNPISTMTHCRQILKKPSLTATDFNMLVDDVERLVGHATGSMQVHGTDTPLKAVTVLGHMFFVVDLLYCAAEVLGDKSGKHIWWPELIRYIEGARYYRSTDTHLGEIPSCLNDIACALSAALDYYRQGSRPPARVVVGLKERILRNPYIKRFQQASWDPWREDSRSWQRQMNLSMPVNREQAAQSTGQS
ncbi:hypothetical protein, conserved [Eimeria praecox]|uniref:Uncharacterized protein n=1 Tax=Eimeria praecox TaxID=51316 RepID=U6G3U8_9EIME|nr:hypothetical protein, conserved [Eimeria praecox]